MKNFFFNSKFIFLSCSIFILFLFSFLVASEEENIYKIEDLIASLEANGELDSDDPIEYDDAEHEAASKEIEKMILEMLEAEGLDPSSSSSSSSGGGSSGIGLEGLAEESGEDFSQDWADLWSDQLDSNTNNNNGEEIDEDGDPIERLEVPRLKGEDSFEKKIDSKDYAVVLFTVPSDLSEEIDVFMDSMYTIFDAEYPMYRVDLSLVENRPIAARYGLEGLKEPVMWIFRSGDGYPYEGSKLPELMYQHLVSIRAAKIRTVAAPELLDLLITESMDEPYVFAGIPVRSQRDSEEYKVFKRLAKRFQPSIRFFVIFDEDVISHAQENHSNLFKINDPKSLSLTILKPRDPASSLEVTRPGGDQDESCEEEGKVRWSFDGLTSWVRAHSIETLAELDSALLAGRFEKNNSDVILILSRKAQSEAETGAIIAQFQEVASTWTAKKATHDAYKDDKDPASRAFQPIEDDSYDRDEVQYLHFYFLDIDRNPSLLEALSMTEDDLPTVGVMRAAIGKDWMLSETEHSFTVEGVNSFLEDYVAGRIERKLRSADIADNSKGPIFIAVGSNWKELVVETRTTNIVVVICAGWADECIQFGMEHLYPVAKALHNFELESDFDPYILRLYNYDLYNNDLPDGVHAPKLPSVLMFPAETAESALKQDTSRPWIRPHIVYDGDLHGKDILAWILANATNMTDEQKRSIKFDVDLFSEWTWEEDQE